MYNNEKLPILFNIFVLQKFREIKYSLKSSRFFSAKSSQNQKLPRLFCKNFVKSILPKIFYFFHLQKFCEIYHCLICTTYVIVGWVLEESHSTKILCNQKLLRLLYFFLSCKWSQIWPTISQCGNTTKWDLG